MAVSRHVGVFQREVELAPHVHVEVVVTGIVGVQHDLFGMVRTGVEQDILRQESLAKNTYRDESVLTKPRVK